MTEKREGVRDTGREVCIDEVGERASERETHTHTHTHAKRGSDR